VEAESDLAFAGLHGLLRPVLAHLRELPGPQSAALAGALGLAPSAGSGRLLICAAVLGLLAAAAEDRPVLCVVDDAQWVDRPSAGALVFAARRISLAGARDAAEDCAAVAGLGGAVAERGEDAGVVRYERAEARREPDAGNQRQDAAHDPGAGRATAGDGRHPAPRGAARRRRGAAAITGRRRG
jgi:hypothetical protein